MEGSRHPVRTADVLAAAAWAAAAACGVLAVGLVAFILWRSAALIALLYVAAMIAVVLDRPVAALARAGLGREYALALVLIGTTVITLAAAVITIGPLISQARELVAAAPAAVDRLRAAFAHRFAGMGDGTPIATSFRETMSRGAGAVAGGAYAAASGLANGAGVLVTVLVMVVVLLAAGPGLVHRAIAALPPSRRPWGEALAGELSHSISAYLSGLGTLVICRILATAALLAVLRVRFVSPLALLAGASVLIPYLGFVLRFVAIGVVAWMTRGLGVAATALAFVAAYDLAENYVLSPIVYRKTLGISALAQLVAVLFFGYHFGAIGAVLAIPLAGTAQIIFRAVRAPGATLRARIAR